MHERIEPMMPMPGRLTAKWDQAVNFDRRYRRESSKLLRYGQEGLLFVPSTSGHETGLPLLVMLHGATYGAHDVMLSVQSAAVDHGCMIFAPKSEGRTWDVIRQGYGPDFRAIDAGLASLFAQYPIDRANVAIGGFSDGASYALTLGLLNGDLFKTILAFSPGFTLATHIVDHPKVYISHGRNDQVLPYERCGAALARMLANAGLDVCFDPFDGGHAVPFDRVVCKAVTNPATGAPA